MTTTTIDPAADPKTPQGLRPSEQAAANATKRVRVRPSRAAKPKAPAPAKRVPKLPEFLLPTDADGKSALLEASPTSMGYAFGKFRPLTRSQFASGAAWSKFQAERAMHLARKADERAQAALNKQQDAARFGGSKGLATVKKLRASLRSLSGMGVSVNVLAEIVKEELGNG